MKFTGFSSEDFDVFAVEGLDERMEALKQTIRPKLEGLGEHFASRLSDKTNEDMYHHVAKHARRKVNPPDDTWVAFANSKRGYKKLPHFQIGLFGSHVFVWFAVIYESPVKEELGQVFKDQLTDIKKQVPESFSWSVDHTKPEVIPHNNISNEKLEEMFERLSTIKKAELLCGLQIDSDDPLLKDGDKLVNKIEEVFDTLMPLYETSMRIYEEKA
ncbi:hypothetical protein CR194_08835 [Salipaludibacillus keqinensis]|uniref:UPF0637 protein CR194_08835 n=1 Tax=Salipaludibacillus keqinensis TaxID=2045207 RepID=A0A323TE26_9BACI|nr:DUF1054 domain-containing protein [Salipaludibacillus keqinensis]PYZ93289.1 hypothetical protein CR194_08835 [Salipaludibacillus keqinensis]